MERSVRNALCKPNTRFGKTVIAFTLALAAILTSAVDADALSKPAHPVILVHGLKSNAGTWGAFLDNVTNVGWTFGGELVFYNGAIYYNTANRHYGGVPRAGDVYTITFTSNTDLTYIEQALELEGVINFILSLTGKSKAICVGHSMGGLACRSYLNYARDPRVSQIITVGTPHLGSYFATVFDDITSSIAIEILRPGSAELAHLNADHQKRQQTTPVAYTSIIVADDTVVSERSQNLSSTGITVPYHTELYVRLADECFLGHFNHLCETYDPNVHISILGEIERRPIALVLEAETPVTGPGRPLRTRLRASSTPRDGYLFLILHTPNGGRYFQRAIGSTIFTSEVVAATTVLETDDVYTINIPAIASALPGIYWYYAVVLDGATGQWISNLGWTTIEVETARVGTRGPLVYAVSHVPTSLGDSGPSNLWEVEIHPEGRDRFVGTIRTPSGYTPTITDIAKLPDGWLAGIGENAVYRIHPQTAEAFLETVLNLPRMNGLTADAAGNLYISTRANDFFGIPIEPGLLYRMTPEGSIVPLAYFGSLGASGDLAFAPDGTLYATQISYEYWVGDDLVAFTLDGSGRVSSARVIGLLYGRYFGLTFSGTKLYGFTTNRAAGFGYLVQIDPRTAHATVIRQLSFQAAGAE